jgi:hypothetical protein
MVEARLPHAVCKDFRLKNVRPLIVGEAVSLKLEVVSEEDSDEVGGGSFLTIRGEAKRVNADDEDKDIIAAYDTLMWVSEYSNAKASSNEE